MLRKAARSICAFLILAGTVAGAEEISIRAMSFGALRGWSTEDHSSALDVFLKSCKYIKGNNISPAEDWKALCKYAASKPDARPFFETFFRPVLIEGGERTLFTGYYEPELVGSRHRDGKFRYPLYRRPKEVEPGQVWKTREQIESGALAGRGLELAWLDDPVENFFLHVQGSGRLKLNDGGIMRVGFDGKNGHKYRSVGQEMIRRGILSINQASAQKIKAWVRKNPVDGRVLLQHNPSFIFFRELQYLDKDSGPPGAMQVSVSKGRTIAVDPRFTPLGAPVWIDKRGGDPVARLMVAQDVGSAIKGPQRADIFYGSGADAGRIAGRTKSAGRMIVLLPIESVRRLLPEG